MKTLLNLLIIIVLTTTALIARDVTLAWDPNDPAEEVTEYRIYEKVGASYTLQGSTTNTILTITNVVPGKHTYVATAVNIWGESDYSNEASTPPGSSSPKNLRLIITIEIQ